MRLRYALWLLSQSIFAFTLALPSAPRSGPLNVSERDVHFHSHHMPPLVELNETEVTLNHAPTPDSYFTLDFDNANMGHRGLMMAHGLFMTLAFFVALPAGIITRSVKHRLHGLSMGLFYLFFFMGCAASSLYRKKTPNMYEGQVHSQQGYLLLALVISLTAVDLICVLVPVASFVGLVSGSHPLKSFRRDESSEYDPLVNSEDVELTELSHSTDRSQPRVSRKNMSGLAEFGQIMLSIAERFAVVAGFAEMLTGVVVYTGGCRQNYLNGCLAHLIKASIFWCYGLLTFARYLGAFSDIGWAWNRAPVSSRAPSAEFVECFVIFLYGVTNTWMERFGANPGDPYTTKQIQHIGIAIMFWFAGLVGMALESKILRKWLASSVALTPPEATLPDPPSYTASFNPFPAVVIGITGSAMAAHFQTYAFEVQVHALWGNLLVAFSILRCLTYFFLWVQPPTSVFPSRPPTEALGSFFLACGGFVFMLSTEEISIAAMRRGRDDVMMFLCVATAMTFFAFCWAFTVVGFKGWLKSQGKEHVA